MTCNDELVSVVITTHNRLEKLKRAIASVERQTYKNIELLVIDDASNDGTREWCNSQDFFQYFFITADESKGACHARNVGLENAAGNLIAFLDDDDEWMPDKIERQAEAISPDISIVSCQWLVEKKNGKWMRCLSSDEDWLLPAILMRCWGGATSVPLLRVSAVRAVGGFDSEVVKGQDHDLWIRLISAGYKEKTVPQPLVRYYLSDDSVYVSLDRLIACTERKLRVYEDLYDRYPDSRSYLLNETAFLCLKQKRFLLFIKYKLRALKSAPLSRWNLFELQQIYFKLKGSDGFQVEQP